MAKTKKTIKKTDVQSEHSEVGGDHYSKMKVEPIRLIEVMQLDFVQGNIVKYISRYKNKGGVEDLRKARHYCEIGSRRFDRSSYYREYNRAEEFAVNMYCEINGLGEIERNVIVNAMKNEYKECMEYIDSLIAA